MKSPLSVLADIWPAPSQRPYTRDEQRFYLEWVVVAVLALPLLLSVAILWTKC